MSWERSHRRAGHRATTLKNGQAFQPEMLIVDVETSGLDPARHSIASIGAVEFFNPANQFNEACRIFPGAEVSDEALAVNGFTRDDLLSLDKRPLDQVARDFFLWAVRIKAHVIAGQNPMFDYGFLRATAERFRLHFPFGRRLTDLHSVAYAAMLAAGAEPPLREGASDLTLDRILAFVGLPPEPKPHLAINGAKLEAEAFSRLVYGKGLLAEFAQYPLPDSLRNRIPQ